jgi:hypothetical protein
MVGHDLIRLGGSRRATPRQRLERSLMEFWAYEPMFAGSVHPKNIVKVFE